MSEPGEAKIGQVPVYEIDAYGVEIVSFNPAFKTDDDVGPPRYIHIPGEAEKDSASYRVHRLRPNFAANMNMFFKFMRGQPPANPLEAITLTNFVGTNVEETLRQMEAEAPGLFKYFQSRSERLQAVVGSPSLGATALRSEVTAAPEFTPTDPNLQQAHAILRNSSGYAFLAPRVQGVSPKFLNT